MFMTSAARAIEYRTHVESAAKKDIQVMIAGAYETHMDRIQGERRWKERRLAYAGS